MYLNFGFAGPRTFAGMRSLGKLILDVSAQGYARWAGSRWGAALNRGLLKAGLRGLGYHDWSGRGERWLIERQLSLLDPVVVFDVGANVGDYAQAVLKATKAQVHCFEPQPAVAEVLRGNLADFGDRAVVVESGVGATESRLNLHYNPNSSELASFSEEVNKIGYVDNAQSVEVPVTTLDAYVARTGLQRVDFIKIDTEGYEREVLLGAQHVIDSLRPKMIQVEFNWHHLLRGTTMYGLAQLLPGYDLYQLTPGGWARRDPMDPTANVFRHSNFVFVLRGVAVA
jgi:FkbM family methyltransferase